MTTRARTFGATILGAMLWPVVFSSLGDARSTTTATSAPTHHQGKAFTPAKKCGECHPTIFKEWGGSAHSRAWTDDVYQKKLKEKKEKHPRKLEPTVCYPCHVPQSVLERLGKKPRRRKDRNTLHEGITCVSCHLHDGKIHGPFGSTTDAHPVEKNPVFTPKNVYGLCASCHDKTIGPVLALGRDFKGAGLDKAGKSCIGCHMPEVERHIAVNALGKPVGPKRKGRRHDILGPGDPEFLATAFKLSAKRDGKDAVVVVENEAGHKVPGLTLRRFVFHVRQLGADGKELAAGKFELHHENLLKVGEKRYFPFARKPGATRLQIRAEHVFEGKVVARFIEKTLDL